MERFALLQSIVLHLPLEVHKHRDAEIGVNTLHLFVTRHIETAYLSKNNFKHKGIFFKVGIEYKFGMSKGWPTQAAGNVQ